MEPRGPMPNPEVLHLLRSSVKMLCYSSLSKILAMVYEITRPCMWRDYFSNWHDSIFIEVDSGEEGFRNIDQIKW